MNIALSMIVKDDSEALMLERCLNSFMPYMSGLYVVVNGLSGKHEKIHEIVKKFGGKSISISPETHPQVYSEVDGKMMFSSFAEARNVSWSIIDKDYDWYTWADVDDVLDNPKELLIAAEKFKDFDSVFFPYWYAVDLNVDGTVKEVVIDQLRERLLKPNKFKWVSRLHEVCVPITEVFIPKQSQGKAVWVHLTDNSRVDKALDRNKTILELQVKEENEKDPRTLYSLAKVYWDIGDDKSLIRAEELLIKYMGMSGWDAERSNVLEYLGMIYEKLGELQRASEIYHRATFEYPGHILPYLKLTNVYFEMGKTEFAKHWLALAMKMDIPEVSTTIGSPKETKILAASLMFKKAKVDGDTKQMVYWAEVRENLGVKDGVLEQIKAHDYMNDAARGVFNYSKWLKDNGYEDSIGKVVESMPPEFRDLPFVNTIRNSVAKPKKWAKNSIVYYASFGLPHFEKWDYNNLKKGIGGSETAVIHLTERWAKKYDVTVYADVPEESISPNGVKWVPYYKINWKDKFNIMILWRSPHLIEKVNARKLFMDLHDVASQLDWDEKRMQKIDKVFFKSKYHRNNVPKLPDKKAVVISNGIVI